MGQIIVGHIGGMSYESGDVCDTNDARPREYVSKIYFRNAGRSVFGDLPYWQEIVFDSPQSIDEMISMLVHAKTMCGYDEDGSGNEPWDECIQRSLLRCNNETTATKTKDGWECKQCREVTTSKRDKPHRCSGCGAYFVRYNF